MARPGRHEEGARTRQRVLEAAAALISAQGYAATSIAQISKRSGANPASIYWAFGSKEGLFTAVMERSAEAFFAQVLDFPRGPDPWQAIADLAPAFEGGPEFLRLLLVLSLERRDGDPAVLEAARRVRTAAADGFAEVYAPDLPVDDRFRRRAIADTLARFTLMLLDGVFVASQIEPDTTDLGRSFQVIAMAVRATGEQLAAEANASPAASQGVPR